MLGKRIMTFSASPSWINLEDHMINVFKTMSDTTVAGMARTMYEGKYTSISINDKLLSLIVRSDSAFICAAITFKNVESVGFNRSHLESLAKRYVVKDAKDPLLLAHQLAEKVAADFNKYPMFKLVGSFRGNEEVIADYINMIDSQTELK
jgi:hypothetical protein